MTTNLRDIERTKHYTTKSEEICSNLLKYIPSDAKLIEPFVGGGDLKNLFPSHDWEVYDIDEGIDGVVHQDTLATPPNYRNKWVITNPPYLAKNKALDKNLFNKYGLDDLYKIAIKTILDSEGGILIIPTNFFTDERTYEIRTEFMERFLVEEINIYTTPAFETTTYSVSAFSFRKAEEKISEQKLRVNIFPENKEVSFLVKKEFGFRLAGDFFSEVEGTRPIFSRLLKDREIPEGKYLTNIKLYALDTRTDRIRLSYEEERYYGSSSDRVYATLISEKELTEEQQKELVDKFNERLNAKRDEYFNLILTNYRDYNRKRIGFTFAYKLCSKIAQEQMENEGA
ncbi:hypothetical protein [Enterococcus saccharolyticus]|uniref:hypothetical protein n=1 Tax=Enterococcus saccharolyticus TaxID=41997 RepID=UPI0039E0BB89